MATMLHYTAAPSEYSILVIPAYTYTLRKKWAVDQRFSLYLEHPPVSTSRVESKLCVVIVNHYMSVVADPQLEVCRNEHTFSEKDELVTRATYFFSF